ncbi:MAG: hypothetical protein PUG10_07305 [Lachnospiraceae bacterium]|nr:hypothetical protein [Lachnospiraceae bacterium]
MRSLHNVLIIAGLLSLASVASGCGKGDDKLVMVTTERSNDTEAIKEEVTEAIETEGTTENTREEASEEEKSITIDMIYEANRGEALLQDKQSYRMNKKYISDGKEEITEEYFLGVDDKGAYVQVFSNSDNETQILDNRNKVWYVTDSKGVSVLICPDEGGVEYAISYQHDNMIFSKKGINGDDLSISDVYKEAGQLVVEMKDQKQEIYRYFLDEKYRIKKCEYCTVDGVVYCEDVISVVDSYTLPTDIRALKESENLRTVSLQFQGEDAHVREYYVDNSVPVKFTESDSKLYKDEEMKELWTEDQAGEDGKYPDITIYVGN